MPKISGVCVGESLVGEGNEVAHVDLLLGPRGSAVEQAYCIALTNTRMASPPYSRWSRRTLCVSRRRSCTTR